MIYYFNEYQLPYDFILPYYMGKDLCLDLDCARYKKFSRKEVAMTYVDSDSDEASDMVLERGQETITKG
jgi:hypothetical protein